MKKVVTFGEIMLKLSALDYKRICQSHLFNVEYSGAEANVAVSLSKYGVNSCFVTKLPDNVLGDSAIELLQSHGVCTSYVTRGGKRIGIYFSEKGASQRPSKVLYDREHTSIAESTVNDYNWKSIFSDASWFHFTGITPALSDDVAAICLEACKVAKGMGLTISCDLNFRSKLWSSSQACKVMSELCKYVDVCIANESDAKDVFGIDSDLPDVVSADIVRSTYKNVAGLLFEKFNFKLVCITLRKAYSASENGWSALMYDGKDFLFGDEYNIHIVDRIGGGDSFGAGLIYAIISGMSNLDALNFAIAASCLKQTIEGDFNLVTADEVFSLMNGNTSGRIQR